MSDTATATSASEVSAAAPRSGKSLLEAFCEGAGLDASLLSSEDPADIMRRAGAVYRQMVIGTAELMADRERARAERDISRTTISGVDNNPFKWAPTQRLAIDLLLAGTGNFLSGPAALQVSFAEIRRHLLASAAGFQASLQAAVATFDPENLDAAIVERASLLKSRAALEMEEVSRRHADLTAQLQGERRGLLERAFVSAYDTAEVEARSRPR